MSRRSLRRLLVPGLVLLALAIAGCGYLLAVGPQRSRAQSLGGDVTAARARLVRLQRERVVPASLHASDLFRLARAMPSDADFQGIVLGLAAAARTSGVSLTAITPTAATPGATGPANVALSVVLEGRFADVSSFLRRLRDEVALRAGRPDVGGRLFDVQQVQITAGTGRSVTANLGLTALVYAPQTTSSTTTTTTTTGSAS